MAATSRYFKYTALILLVCIVFFLGSFNATLRYIVDQKRGSNEKLQNRHPSHQHKTDKLNFYRNEIDDSSYSSSSSSQQQSSPLHVQHDQLLQQERLRPTLGKYKSFIRPLDEFPLHNDTYSKLQFPPKNSPHSNSVALLADAHFAKALRMVSSNFDRLVDGGNAIPEMVFEGGYHQSVGHGGRGVAFVGMMSYRDSRRRVKRRLRNEEAKDASVVRLILRTAHELYWDAIGSLYEVLGVDLDRDEVNGSVSGGVDAKKYKMRNEEDIFSWSNTRVGGQLLSIYGTIRSLLSRHDESGRDDATVYRATRLLSTSESTPSDGEILSKEDRMALEGLYHLEKAAELGHPEAQRMVANSLVSGILPLSDHSLIQRFAAWQEFTLHNADDNLTSILARSSLNTPEDFSSGGEQLSRAIVLWHLSAMSGNVESAMALGFRHLYSATGGMTKIVDSMDEQFFSMGYSTTDGGSSNIHGTTPISHYGVLGTCPTALAYYEAAANGIMDMYETGSTKAKVLPPIDEHRLAEIHMHGGASVALEHHNKPDEIEEALQYYRMLASRTRSPEPDLVAAFTIANFYHLGLRGVKQDLRLALKYYEICGDYNHWEGGGIAGLMHVWGIGMSPQERDLGKAYTYFLRGTPGGIEGCKDKMKTKKKANNNNDADDVKFCERHCANGMGLISLFGVEGLIERNVNDARKWFEISKDLGDADGQYNYAMLRLGWMVTELNNEMFKKDDTNPTLPFIPPDISPIRSSSQLNYLVHRHQQPLYHDTYNGPSASDYNVAIQELTRAASKGHIQAKHKLAMLYATGAEVPKKVGRPTIAVRQSCVTSLKYYKSIADSGHTVSRRNRAAWKQYNSGDFDSSLRNYLATAETGSIVGQLNAAFLLERGYCLGMTTVACTHASIRLWRAAARQGNLEACLRVGDFYYYGRMRNSSTRMNATSGFHHSEQIIVQSFDGKALYFAPGPFQWSRYILYPEEAFSVLWSWIIRKTKVLLNFISNQSVEVSSDLSCTSEEGAPGVCDSHQYSVTGPPTDLNQIDHNHLAIAAQYYRKAAEDHKSARANFNLGFMYEWGLGLTQDFPLAKRHYDLAKEEADIAASLALYAMSLHEKLLRVGMYFSERIRHKQ